MSRLSDGARRWKEMQSGWGGAVTSKGLEGTKPPPKRLPTGLLPEDVEIVALRGERTMVMRTDRDMLLALVLKVPLRLGKSELRSVISGEPAFLYRTFELEVALTLEEISRMTRCDLFPFEVAKLRELFGVFYETNFALYEQSSGKALDAAWLGGQI